MKIKIYNSDNQKFKYNNFSTSNFKGGLKISNLPELEKDLFKKSAGVSTILTTAAVASSEIDRNKSPENKLSLNKILLKNLFSMNIAAKDAAVKSIVKTPKENRQAALKALNTIQIQYKQKNIDDSYRYSAISNLIPLVNNENLSLFEEILKADVESLKEKKQTRFQGHYIKEILNLNSQENFEKFNIVKNLKNSYGNYKYKDFDIFLLLKDDEIKPKYLKQILQSDYAKDIQSFQTTEIARNVNSENERILPALLNYKDKYNIGHYFDTYNIIDILQCINSDNINPAVDLLENEDYKWLPEKISKYEYKELISCLNKDNSEILPIVMKEFKKSSFKVESGSFSFHNGVMIFDDILISFDEVCNVLKNVSNEDVEIFKECLYLKDSEHPDCHYFSVHYAETLPELVELFKNKDLEPIGRELINKKDSKGDSRFNNLKGIKDLSEIIYENDKTKIENLNHILNLEENSQPRFKNMQDIVNITKILNDTDKKDKLLHIIDIKGYEGYRFDDFSNTDLTDKITKDLDLAKIDVLANVKDTPIGGYSLSLEKIIDLSHKFENLTAEQIPVPEILPPNIYLSQALDYLDRYQQKKLNLNSLTIKDKIMLNRYTTALVNLPEAKKKAFLLNVDSLSRDITKAISKTIMPTETDNVAKVNLFKFVLSNKPEIENIIKNADFTQFEKKGLPIVYSRKEFLKDLNNILDSQNDNISSSILEKLQIELNEDKTGYEGIINLLELNKNDETEKRVYDICEKFILGNEIKTDDEAFDHSMNALIKGMPEFINIIGKQPHGSHNYSIDIHILEVLKNCINYPDYDKLPSLDKTRLKFAVLLHDIAKKEGVVDKNHQNLSALYARNILEKYPISQSIKDDIYLLVKNHHWLEALNTNATDLDTLSCNFKNSNDFKMSKIFAYADLKAVSKDIFDAFSPVLKSNEVKKLEQKIEKNKQTGNPLYTSRVVYKNRIPKQEFDGKTYKVFNFKSYSDDKDLSEVGFVDGTKKKDLRFLMHVVSNAENLNTVETLSDIANNSVLSESFISLNNNSSYYNDGIGVILETDIPNIANAYYENQGSGYAKGQEAFVEMKTSDYRKNYREFIPKKIQEKLNITPEQYAKLFDIVSQKKFLTQISDSDEFDVGGEFLNGKAVREALREAQDEIMPKYSHNEVVAANSKVVGLAAKEDALENISSEYLNFAQHYDLPVYLLGKKLK